MTNNFLLVMSAFLPLVNYAMEAQDITMKLPKAVGIKEASMIMSVEKFAKMDGYFKRINQIPKVKPAEMDATNFAAAAASNAIAMVSMNDSCLAKPHSGVEFISLDNLQDCVGLFAYHEAVGTAAAHITMGTSLPSLNKLLAPFAGKSDVKITLMTSWKTKLLQNVVREVHQRGLSVNALWVNNVVQVTNAEGSILERYLDTSEFPGLANHLAAGGTLDPTSEAAKEIAKKISSPVGAIIDTTSGRISFVKNDEATQPHNSSSIIRATRDLLHTLPTFSSERYKTIVKPNENKRNVDIAFIEYPIM